MKVEVLLSSGEGGVAQTVDADNVIQAIEKVARNQIKPELVTSIQAKVVV